MSARLLLVEDERSLARGLVDNFRAEGYDVRHVARGDLARPPSASSTRASSLLDIMLPGRSGLDCSSDLRRRVSACRC